MVSRTTSDAIIVTVDSLRTRSSTQDALLTLAIPLEKAALISRFMGMIDKQVAVAFAEIGGESTLEDHSDETKPFGKYATELYRLGWFYNFTVLYNIGTDADYLAWIEKQDCCDTVMLKVGDQLVDHVGDVVAAHVRRIADGAGTAVKPPYSAIPLCFGHHALQHQDGESAIGGKVWCDTQRNKFLKEWASTTLAKKLGYSSMGMVPTDELLKWARLYEIESTLPPCYREE